MCFTLAYVLLAICSIQSHLVMLLLSCSRRSLKLVTVHMKYVFNRTFVFDKPADSYTGVASISFISRLGECMAVHIGLRIM